MDDTELLRRYVRGRSEEAFHELVRRKFPLVYSAALRQVNGDVHRANDVAQAVFIALATKAGSLLRHPSLTGWLYASTRFAARAAVRSESRRQRWEKESHLMNTPSETRQPDQELPWSRIGAVLDEAMHGLRASDRDVVLLRFFENQSLAAIGSRYGLTEDAARKRVVRALDRLQQELARRGVVSTATALMGGLAHGATGAVPTGLAAAASGAALTTVAAGSVASSGIALMTLGKAGIAAAIALLVITADLQYRLKGLRAEAAERRSNDRGAIAALEAELESLRAVPATRMEVPEPASAVMPAARARIDAIRFLRARGASVAVPFFGPNSTDASLAAARTFFRFTDDEEVKVRAAIDRAKTATDEGATAGAAITRTEEFYLTISVPAFDGGGIYSQFAADLEAALGSERAKELLEISAAEITESLDNAGTGARTITVTRRAAPPTASGQAVQQFSAIESGRSSQFSAPAESARYKWLSRFDEQIYALTPRPAQ